MSDSLCGSFPAKAGHSVGRCVQDAGSQRVIDMGKHSAEHRQGRWSM